MREGGRLIDGAAGRAVRLELKTVVAEASQALARLDAARLEELALSCAALNRRITEGDTIDRAALAVEARQAVAEMAVFARVLEATRGNIRVMNRLRELRMGRLEYGERPSPADGWNAAAQGEGSGHGND